MRALILAALLLAACDTAASGERTGLAYAVDGDTLDLNGQRVRLWGVQAPERGDRGAEAATAALSAMLTTGPISCRVLDIDRYGRSVAICGTPAHPDFARELVDAGLAVDWPRYSRGYYAR